MPEPITGASLGERLKIARITKKLRQADVASAVGTAVTRISEWENDVYVPGAANLEALARTLGVSSRWLLEGADDDTPRGPEPEKVTVPRDTWHQDWLPGVGPGPALPAPLEEIRASFERDLVTSDVSVLDLVFVRRLLYAPEIMPMIANSPDPERSLNRLFYHLSGWLLDQSDLRRAHPEKQRGRMVAVAERARSYERTNQRLLNIIDEAQRADAALPPGVKQSEGGDPVERPGTAKKRTGKPA